MFVFETRKRSRWWTDTGVLVVAMSLTFSLCLGLEDNAQSSDTDTVSFHWAEVNFTYRDPVTNKQMNETAEGKYGAESLVEQKTGLVMHIHNKDNKSHGCKDYTNKIIPQVPWIALIERGVCLFTEKIKRATQTYNATAVVIYNNDSDDEDSITVMQHSVKTHVSIFVSQKTGKELARLADSGVKVEMTIIPGRKELTGGHGPHNSISKTSVLFVSISFIVLMIISLAWLVFYYIQRFRYAHAKERLARRLTSAARKAIGKIPQKTVKVGDRELDSEFDQCAVCIEIYKPHDVIRTLPCKHVFHKSCVDPWLLDQRSCPMCKLDILRAYGMQVMGSQESVHQDPEAGNATAAAPQADEGDPGAATEEQVLPDTEVKVLLLPHTCLHFHSDQDPAPPTEGPSTRPDEHAAASSHPVKKSTSSERLTVVTSWQDSEMQALMAGRRDMEEEEDEEEEDGGFGRGSEKEGRDRRMDGDLST
ncbi:hypothetical protein ACOMHN_048059 [Nucella lapillus]